MYKRIALIMMLMVLIAPAMAYTELSTFDLRVPTAAQPSSLNTPYFPLTVLDYPSFAMNVTYIKIETTGYKADNLTKSYPSMPISIATYGVVGNATVQWTWSAAGTYSGAGTIEIFIDDIAIPPAMVGSQGLRIGYVDATTGGIPCRNWRSHIDPIGTTWGSFNATQYAAKVSWTYPTNGTVTFYGGAAMTSAPPSGTYACNLAGMTLAPNPYNLQCWPDEVIYPSASNWSWIITQPDNSTYSSTNETLVKILNIDGWHELDYSVCNSYGCGYSNTTQLVNVTSSFIPATGIKFWVHTYDPLKSAKISGSQIMIQNITSGGWRNVSTSAGSAYFDATNYARTELLTQGQTVKVCGSAPGYAETCANATIAYNDWEYTLNLVSTSDTPIGTNTTLIVNVIDTYTAETLSGATITVSNISVPYSSSKLSDAGGIQTFPNIPAGTYQIVASKSGYQTSTTSWPTTAGTVANAYIGLTVVGATPIVTGTSGQPLYDENGNPIIGYDLDGNPITAGPTQDLRTSDEKDEDMMDSLRTNGPFLIEFFIVCFVLYMISGIGKK